MSRSFDVKSGLIGGLLALLILSALGGAPWMDRDIDGRFAMMSHPGHAFLVDSATGEVWSIRVLDGSTTVAERGTQSDRDFYEAKLDTGFDPNAPIY